MTAPLWYFVHIPKTAGTTVRYYLHDSFAPDEVLFVYPGDVSVPGAHVRSFEEVAAMPWAEIASYRVLYGHYGFNPAWFVHDRCRGLAFVREPRARVASWFQYVESIEPEGCTPRQRGHVEAIRDRGLDLEGLFEAVGGIAEIDNGIVRYLGAAGGDPIGAIGDAQLARARRHVEEHFDFVGHAGHFERSMERISAVLGRPYRPRGRMNASPAGRAEQLLARHSSAFLERLTAVDAELVAWVEQQFFGR